MSIEQFLLTEQVMQEGVAAAFLQGRTGIFSTRCPDRDSPNEDAVALIPLNGRRGVLAVADGVGGLPGGAHASQIALRELAGAVVRAPAEEGGLRAAILDGFENANRAVLDLGLGAATTLAAVEIQESHIRTYHVGDSMILVTGQRGRIKLQTISHSPTGYAVEAGLLDEKEAMVHEDRHLVSNLLGSPDMRIEMGSALRLAPHDTLVLASDGLSDNLEVGEIAELARKGPLPEVLAALAAAALRRMGDGDNGHPSKPDDLTFLVYRSR